MTKSRTDSTSNFPWWRKMKSLASILELRSARLPNAFSFWRLDPLEHHGANYSAMATSASGTEWFVKFCKDPGGVPNICEREEFASLLGELVEIPVVESFCVPTATFGEVASLFPRATDLMIDKCVAMRLVRGTTVAKNPEGTIKFVRMHPEKLADIFAFCLWIGDEDRGPEDVMIENGTPVLIDNGLSGPGRSHRLRSAHPAANVYKQIDVIKMCYPAKKPGFVEFTIRELSDPATQLAAPKVIEQISRIQNSDLESAVSHSRLETWVSNELIRRRDNLRNDYSKWLKAAVDCCWVPEGSRHPVNS